MSNTTAKQSLTMSTTVTTEKTRALITKRAGDNHQVITDKCVQTTGARLDYNDGCDENARDANVKVKTREQATASQQASDNAAYELKPPIKADSSEPSSSISRRRSLAASRIDETGEMQPRSRLRARIDPGRFSWLSAACSSQTDTRGAVVNSEEARSPADSRQSISCRRRSLAASRIAEDDCPQPGQPPAVKVDQEPLLGSSAASGSQTHTHYAAVNAEEQARRSDVSEQFSHLQLTDTASLWVASSAHWMKLDSDPERAAEIEIDGKCYRRLDARYWTWLTATMEAATQAFETGKLSAVDYAPLWVRFGELKAMAGEQFAEAEVEQERRWLRANRYQPPKVSELSSTVDRTTANDAVGDRDAKIDADAEVKSPQRHRFSQEVSAAAIAKVDAIREKALILGWTEAELYSTTGEFQFPIGNGWGLVYFVEGDEVEIGEVTSEVIVIRKGAVGGRKSVMRWRRTGRR